MTIKWRDLLLSGAPCCAARRPATFTSARQAHEYEIGKLIVEHPWCARARRRQQGIFLCLHSQQREAAMADRLKAEKFGRSSFTPTPGGRPSRASRSHQSKPPPSRRGALCYCSTSEAPRVGWALDDADLREGRRCRHRRGDRSPRRPHAHDADAQARWEKAHNKDTAGPAGAPPAPAPHDHDHHDAIPGMPAPRSDEIAHLRQTDQTSWREVNCGCHFR